MTIIPTPEQEAIFSAALDSNTSLMIQAYAGCAKTSTLEMLSQRLPQGTRGLALAFNVRIKKELEKRLPESFEVKTLNGLGHSAWNRAISKRCEVDDRKVGKLVTDLAKLQGLALSIEQWQGVRKLVDQARQVGLVPSDFSAFKGLVPDVRSEWERLCQDDESKFIPFARAVLVQSIKLGYSGIIDYDDQIYLSSMFGGLFPKYPLVLVDESQDLSVLNHRQVSRVAGRGGRLIVVGDPKQAIYSWRGADGNSMESLKKLRPDWIILPLATTFRCPQVIVERNFKHALGFTAWHTNPIGELLDWTNEDTQWDWADVQETRSGACGESQGTLNDNDCAVLCRNNAPLLKLAFKLIRSGVGCQMLGRDIGKNLVALAKKIIPSEATRDTIAPIIDRWINSERQLAEANDRPEKIASIVDRGECLLAVCQSKPINSISELVKQLEHLFSRDRGVVLSTIHKAKGLEWPLVLHLDPWRIPAKYTRGDVKAMEQEYNLRYVCETRTKHTLILANLDDFKEPNS